MRLTLSYINNAVEYCRKMHTPIYFIFDPDLCINQINPTLCNFIINITKGKWNTSMTHEKKAVMYLQFMCSDVLYK